MKSSDTMEEHQGTQNEFCAEDHVTEDDVRRYIQAQFQDLNLLDDDIDTFLFNALEVFDLAPDSLLCGDSLSQAEIIQKILVAIKHRQDVKSLFLQLRKDLRKKEQERY